METPRRWAQSPLRAKEHYGAATVAIVSADNIGANASEAALTAALDVAGIAHTTIKGGDNETDAGYPGPDAPGRRRAIRICSCRSTPMPGASERSGAGHRSGIEIPVVTTGICADRAVIDAVGDDALGWTFVGIPTNEDTPEKLMLQEMLSPALGIPPEEVDPTALGLGGLGTVMVMSLAGYGSRDGRTPEPR